MSRYKFKGYTITNCGYHQPDHCVWWEAVDENGEACFHGNSLREVEFMILDDEWEKKLREKDAEIERLKHSSVGNAAAMREALINVRRDLWDMMGTISEALQNRIATDIRATIRAALSAPARKCDTTESTDEIATRFKSEVCDHYDNDWEDPRTQCSHNCVECVTKKWMTAEKGGAE